MWILHKCVVPAIKKKSLKLLAILELYAHITQMAADLPLPTSNVLWHLCIPVIATANGKEIDGSHIRLLGAVYSGIVT